MPTTLWDWLILIGMIAVTTCVALFALSMLCAFIGAVVIGFSREFHRAFTDAYREKTAVGAREAVRLPRKQDGAGSSPADSSKNLRVLD